MMTVVTRLDDLCEAVVDCPHSTPVWTDNGALVLRSQNIRSGRLNLSTKSFTDEDHYRDRSRRAEVRAGDIVITREAPMGEVCMIPPGLRCCLGQRMVLLRPNALKCDSRYLLYALQSQSLREQISWSEGTGSTVSNLRIPHLKALLVPTPSMKQQEEIGSALGALDDKIEQNRRTAQALEGLARAIFRAWFVDFEPVKAKAAGAGAFPSMPQRVFDAMPTSCVNSTMGPIPWGWEVSTVGDCTSYLNRGIAPRYLEKAGVLVLNQKCIRDFAIDYGKARRHDTSSRGIEGREIKVGDVLINSTGVGTLGRLAQVLDLPEPAIVDTHVTVVRPSSRLNASYFGQALAFMQPHIESLGEGSTGQTELHRRKISELKLLVPSSQLLDSFQDLVAPLMNLVSHTRLESESLFKLRDYLLPKLISGDVLVRVNGESSSD